MFLYLVGPVVAVILLTRYGASLAVQPATAR
jgi:hypothetical protein